MNFTKHILPLFVFSFPILLSFMTSDGLVAQEIFQSPLPAAEGAYPVAQPCSQCEAWNSAPVVQGCQVCDASQFGGQPTMTYRSEVRKQLIPMGNNTYFEQTTIVQVPNVIVPMTRNVPEITYQGGLGATPEELISGQISDLNDEVSDLKDEVKKLTNMINRLLQDSGDTSADANSDLEPSIIDDQVPPTPNTGGTDFSPRKWIDASGRFSVEAQLVSVRSDNITLMKSSGAKLRVAIENLSEVDREFLKLSRSLAAK